MRKKTGDPAYESASGKIKVDTEKVPTFIFLL
jgi:hypothetical protein